MNDEASKKIIAWCPDDTDESGALEYSGRTPGEVAEAHAEFLHGRGDPCESYDIRVRVTSGGQVREWDVCVDVEMVGFAREVPERPTAHEVEQLASPSPENPTTSQEPSVTKRRGQAVEKLHEPPSTRDSGGAQ